MRILRSDEVVERFATEFIGKYIGHTTPKTRDLLRSGIGKGLVINDTHGMTSDEFASEAFDELISFARVNSSKMVVILIGLENGVNQLMKRKPELGSCFPVEIMLDKLSLDECLILLDKILRGNRALGPFLAPKSSTKRRHKAIGILSNFPGWRNAIDIKHLAQLMLNRIPYDAWDNIPPTQDVQLPEESAMDCIKDMFCTKKRRANSRVGAGEVEKFFEG
ncbi:hypothetical protein B0T14DRAFT_214680 [Immersiella caudata]|uniref:Uncharacterized protein n=1 Tax=Immersiella caudata TaxID=314043 RepID=A0AA39WQR4_9PEZI|nr:hypothetical protein B0T14DRAFT_214680 [Immersiella caudata]